MAVTGKPLAATAGAMIFQKGGNAVDAACAMIAATSTMWDTLSWGGETQALIYNPNTGKVIGINALGVAPTGATPEFFHKQGMKFPPEFGPLAAVTPGTPGGLMTMLAEYGTMSLAEVLAPAIEMADGYPMEAELSNTIEHYRGQDRAVAVLEADTSHPPGRGTQGPQPGEIFHQPELAATCASWSRRSTRRRPMARTARQRSMPPMTVSTRAILRASWSVARGSKADSLR